MNEAAAMPRADGVPDTVSPGPRDGRNRRAAETRRKIIAAAKAMIDETSEAPTGVGVARRADVSVRSVFQHFKDVQSLFVTVVDSIGQGLVVPAPGPRDSALTARVDEVVTGLGRLFDQIVPLRVAAGQFVGHPALVERAMVLRQQVREATADVFRGEFSTLGPEATEALADAIGAALSLDAWVVMRRQQKLGFERAVAAWRLTLTALLEHGLVVPSCK